MLTIRFRLNAAGRKAALKAGIKATEDQEIQIANDHPAFAQALEMAEINSEGTAVVKVPFTPCGTNIDPVEFDHVPNPEEVLAAYQAHIAKVAQAEEESEKKKEEERKAEWARLFSLPVGERVHQNLCYGVISHPKAISPEEKTWVAEAEAEYKKRQEAEDAEEKAYKARKRAKEEAEEAEEIAWIKEYGSVKLQRSKVEKFENVKGLYQTERLAFEAPGWEFYDRICGETHIPRVGSVAVEMFAILDEARKLFPGASLSWLGSGVHTGSCKCGEEYKEEKRIPEPRMVIEAEWRGFTIIREI